MSGGPTVLSAGGQYYRRITPSQTPIALGPVRGGAQHDLPASQTLRARDG